MILYRQVANRVGVRLLPDSTLVLSGSAPDAAYSIQRGILDSLRLGDITIYNLPILVSDEPVRYDADGFIGTLDLARLEYMELSQDSITFRYPVPQRTEDVNFRMNAGDRGDRCIILSCVLDAHPFSFLLDTGADSFILPPQFAHRKNGVYAQVGGQSMWLGGIHSHSFAPYSDSIGIFGSPLLGAFKKLCINFLDSHIDYIKKTDVDMIEFRMGNK